MLTRHLITRRADEDGVDAAIAERDYVLAHIVSQLHFARPMDGGRLVFKGGTALRLVHMRDYRYSADLDFTIVGGGVDASITALSVSIEAARDQAGFPLLELTSDATGVAYVGPLGAKPRRIKLDMATDEYVETVTHAAVLDGVWNDLPAREPFDVYPVDEIAAEKLRCIIQRVQCRDLYDLYRLADDMNVSFAEVRPLFERKAEAKGLDPAAFPDKFGDRLDRYRQRWEREMSEHVAPVPRFDDVVRVVRRHLRNAGMVSDRS
jgi:predicted nucleotidyltransferase component of viral defense system